MKPVSRTELGERDRMGKVSSARSQENGIAMEVEKILLPVGEFPNVNCIQDFPSDYLAEPKLPYL